MANLVETFLAGEAPLVIPTYEARRGHPTLFRHTLFGALRDPALQGGARTVVHAHLEGAALVPVTDEGVVQDIDTPEAYRAAFRAGVPPMSLDAALAAALSLEAVERGGSTAVAAGGRRSLRRRAPRPRSGRRRRGAACTAPWASPALDAAALAAARAALGDPRHQDGLAEPHPGHEVYVEVRRPVLDLVIVGAGHIARPMARLGSDLGYRVWVLDDRPDFATRERFPEAHQVIRADFSDPFRDVPVHERTHLLLVTRGHKYDYDCLVRVLRGDPLPAYIGMIGSRRRVRATFVQLLEDGIDRSKLRAIHAPVGLDIGAETPEEIAVAVAAELVRVRRGGSGASLRDLERVADRFFNQAEHDA